MSYPFDHSLAAIADVPRFLDCDCCHHDMAARSHVLPEASVAPATATLALVPLAAHGEGVGGEVPWRATACRASMTIEMRRPVAANNECDGGERLAQASAGGRAAASLRLAAAPVRLAR